MLSESGSTTAPEEVKEITKEEIRQETIELKKIRRRTSNSN